VDRAIIFAAKGTTMAEENKPTRQRTAAKKPVSATGGASVGETKARASRTSAKATSAKATSAKTDAWREQAGVFAEQALGAAKTAATTAKNSTGTALHGLSKIIGETAGTVDSRLGPQYGDYARQAAEAVAGAAKSLEEKDVNQLTEEARDFVRKSPAVAIGAAAVVGFVLMRLARGSGSSDES
jgi:ElaB/YqjD/DUF883 family membrane-anchored ribosome-binding protein